MTLPDGADHKIRWGSSTAIAATTAAPNPGSSASRGPSETPPTTLPARSTGSSSGCKARRRGCRIRAPRRAPSAQWAARSGRARSTWNPFTPSISEVPAGSLPRGSATRQGTSRPGRRRSNLPRSAGGRSRAERCHSRRRTGLGSRPGPGQRASTALRSRPRPASRDRLARHVPRTPGGRRRRRPPKAPEAEHHRHEDRDVARVEIPRPDVRPPGQHRTG